jgi:formylglycine-generating enzyme required for sulfatase activity
MKLLLVSALGLMACGGEDRGGSPAGPAAGSASGSPEQPPPESPPPGTKEEVFAVRLPGGETVAFEFVWIEPGTFLMGSQAAEPEREEGEGPRHEVTISRGFWLGKYEITQEQWAAVTHTSPWSGQAFVVEDPKCPASYISWEDVQAFIRLLNEADGSTAYRLPTEAEWEYACRAGTTTYWFFGDDSAPLGEYAWYKVNAWDLGEQYAHPVGAKRPNPWGLYDVYGNVWEWVQDWFSDTYYGNSPAVDPQGPETGLLRVRRGADFHYYDWGTRSARRGRSTPLFVNCVVGARLLRQEP